MRRDDDTAERQVARRYAFGADDDVGLQAKAAAREPVAHTPESNDHLVGDEQDASLPARLPQLLQVALRRGEDSARTDDGLAEDRRDTLRSIVVDGFHEVVDRVPPDTQHPVQKERLPCPVGRNTSQACTCDMHAVIGVLTYHKGTAVGLAGDGEVSVDELGRTVDRVRSARRQEDLRSGHGRYGSDQIGQL